MPCSRFRLQNTADHHPFLLFAAVLADALAGTDLVPFVVFDFAGFSVFSVLTASAALLAAAGISGVIAAAVSTACLN